MAKIISIASLFLAAAVGAHAAAPNNIFNFNDPTAHLVVNLDNTVGAGGGFDWFVANSTFASLRIVFGDCQGDLGDPTSLVNAHISQVRCENNNMQNDKHCITVDVPPTSKAVSIGFDSTGVYSARGNRHVHINIEGDVSAQSYFGIKNMLNCRANDIHQGADPHHDACAAFTMPLNTTGTPKFSSDSMFFFSDTVATYIPTVSPVVGDPFHILSYNVEAADAVTTGGIFWHQNISLVDVDGPSPYSALSAAIGGRFDGGISASQFTFNALNDVYPFVASGLFTGRATFVGNNILATAPVAGGAKRALNGPFVDADFTNSVLKFYNVQTPNITVGRRHDDSHGKPAEKATFTNSTFEVFWYVPGSVSSNKDANGIHIRHVAFTRNSNSTIRDCDAFNGGSIYTADVLVTSGSIATIEGVKGIENIVFADVAVTGCDRKTNACGLFVNSNTMRTLVTGPLTVDDSLFLIYDNNGIPLPGNVFPFPQMSITAVGNGVLSMIDNNGFWTNAVALQGFNGNFEMWADRFDYNSTATFDTLISVGNFPDVKYIPKRMMFSTVSAHLNLWGDAVVTDSKMVLDTLLFGCADISYPANDPDNPGQLVYVPAKQKVACEAKNFMARCDEGLSLYFDPNAVRHDDVTSKRVMPCTVKQQQQGIIASGKQKGGGAFVAPPPPRKGLRLR